MASLYIFLIYGSMKYYIMALYGVISIYSSLVLYALYIYWLLHFYLYRRLICELYTCTYTCVGGAALQYEYIFDVSIYLLYFLACHRVICCGMCKVETFGCACAIYRYVVVEVVAWRECMLACVSLSLYWHLPVPAHGAGRALLFAPY